ncbi:type VII secretion target [Nocardia cyriacigeorgica]|jgi:purine nucleoside permease|uniref:ESX-1 secretion-associated protein n=1 Tax=Nocardia cyriacigeorgica TaxID=135487 RepID=A0A2L2JM12_9NOCA|nr:type VII secretion target [Nocardia cyriacigeorgica]AVH20899.1 hypothetical protein C5B73_04860 [Nocardia cyriacigeorgica]MBF6286094.1 hypothetical protein [Nocardia cyriacigeorgica]MBF6325377.1 hypothetical protein [Nocardia cyriacigeorgica]NEW32985.1 hypothetical protein [Nocardia cyriacigeorgica]PPJ08169.1 hypothetical protein C5E43_17165 [Nocardia cyriacigeorgica]
MLQADIDQLNRLATTLNDVGNSIDALEIRTVGDQLAAALPGAPIPATCAKAGEYTEGAWLRVAQRIRQLANITTQCAANYQMTDEEFAKQLDTMAFHPPKDR